MLNLRRWSVGGWIVAIGSDPEIGVEFTTWGRMSDEARAAWFLHMTEQWGPDLMGGYGRTAHPDPERRRWYAEETSWLPVTT